MFIIYTIKCIQIKFSRIGGVRVSMLASSVVDRGFEPRLC